MATHGFTDDEFFADVLRRLNLPVRKASLRAGRGWSQAEGGDRANDASFNLYNTTKRKKGSRSINSVGVQAYRSLKQGERATAQTLRLPAYDDLRDALEHGSAREIADEIANSPWGTSDALIHQTVAAAQRPSKLPAGSKLRDAASSAAQAPTGAPAALESSPVADALLARLQTPRAAVQSMGLQAPAHSATVKLPDGYQAPAGGSPQATTQTSVKDVLSSALTVGSQAVEAAPHATSAPRTPKAGGESAAVGAEAAVAYAKSKLGKAETSENHGQYVDRLEKRFGFNGAAWCAMFTSSAVVQGGAPASARSASVSTIRAKAQAKDGYRGFVRPGHERAGDLILFGNDHIGMIVGVHGNQLMMVAGNDSDRVNRRPVARGSGDVVRPAYANRRAR